MYELLIKDQFCSAHYLKGYEGKCKNLHGHSWKIEATIMAEELDNIGMVVDFTILKGKLKEILEKLDHDCLNELDAFKESNPTSENLAKYIFDQFSKSCHPLKVKNVRVWESDQAGVTYYQ